MDYIFTDIITYGAADMAACGVYRYAGEPDVAPLLVLYAMNDDPMGCADICHGEELPEQVRRALLSPDIRKYAYDANRTRVLLSKYLGTPVSPRGWVSVDVMAAQIGFPLDFTACARAMHLTDEDGTAGTGRMLERRFCSPGPKGRRSLPEATSEDWTAFRQAMIRRTEMQRIICGRVRQYNVHVPNEEAMLYELDQRINDRGVPFDTDLAEAALELDARRMEEIDAAAPGRYAAERRMTAPTKYDAIMRCVCADGRIRGLLQFHGTHTGRWAGRLVQVQNLPRTHTPDIGLARGMVAGRDYDSLSCGYSDVRGVLGELVRTAIIPSPGNLLLVCDYSAIEARVLAWLAGETWVLDTFRAGHDLYAVTASKMYGVPAAGAAEDKGLRERGKVATLALGYGGGVAALRGMAAGSLGPGTADLPGMVARWRQARPATVRFWEKVYRACYRAVDEGCCTDLGHGMYTDFRAGMLRIMLPSGRTLCYPGARIAHDGREMEYMGVGAGRWGPVRTYPGRLTENIVQAVARDILAYAIIQAEARGWQVIFHVHDEIIIDAPGGLTAELLEDQFSQAPPWAMGLPLEGKGYKARYYVKK